MPHRRIHRRNPETGLTDPEYDRRTKYKQEICKKHGIDLISIFPENLASVRKLETKLKIKRLETLQLKVNSAKP